jgi:hypothetical protein
MSKHLRPLGLLGGTMLLAGALALTGCASSGPTKAKTKTTTAPGGAMTPGMIMPDGSTMGAEQAAPAADRPSAAAQMICADETREAIKTVLTLKTTPVGKATWTDHLYTCTYALPMGTLHLSVKESTNATTAGAYYTEQRKAAPHAAELAGLTDSAFGTPDGTVVLRKDNDVLRVDATGLPAVFGAQQQKRADFAYELASDILGCWTGD